MKQICRYALEKELNDIHIQKDYENLRVLVSPTDGQINLYADVTVNEPKIKLLIGVTYTGNNAPTNGTFLGSGYHDSLVYHVYNLGQVQNPEKCIIFRYPENGTGDMVERVLFDYYFDFGTHLIKGNDESRDGQVRHFRIDKIEKGVILFDNRVRKY